MTSHQDAADALRERGVSAVEPLLGLRTPEQILAVCERFDRRPGGGPGLLVKMVREDAPPDPPEDELRRRFDAYLSQRPIGTAWVTHRQGNDDDCDGRMVITEARFPFIVIECDACGWVGGMPARVLPPGGTEPGPRAARAGVMPDRAIQRADALRVANAHRLQAAELRAKIKAAGPRDGAIEAARVVRAGESSLTFFGLLTSVPWVGETSARRMLAAAQIKETRRINDGLIDGRRRELLACTLEARATRPKR